MFLLRIINKNIMVKFLQKFMPEAIALLLVCGFFIFEVNNTLAVDSIKTGDNDNKLIKDVSINVDRINVLSTDKIRKEDLSGPKKKLGTDLLKIIDNVNEKMPNAKLLIIGKPTFPNYYKKINISDC